MRSRSMIWATPKSISFRMPSLRTITLSGLTSRWMIPSEWACMRALAISMAISAATSGGGGLRLAMNCFSVWPSMNSVTMYDADESMPE